VSSGYFDRSSPPRSLANASNRFVVAQQREREGRVPVLNPRVGACEEDLIEYPSQGRYRRCVFKPSERQRRIEFVVVAKPRSLQSRDQGRAVLRLDRRIRDSAGLKESFKYFAKIVHASEHSRGGSARSSWGAKSSHARVGALLLAQRSAYFAQPINVDSG
jgi:hypothetical protein